MQDNAIRYHSIPRNAFLLQSAVVSHLLCAEVGVAAGAVPVPWDWFGVEGRDHAEVFTHSVKDEASDPQMVSHVDAFAGPDLELPLKPNRDVSNMNN